MKKFIQEFKDFALNSNLLQLATAVIIGGAVNTLVSSLVESILMPIVGVFLGGVDFSGLSYTVGDSVIKYGAFVQSLIDFFIMMLCIFFIVKIVNSLNKNKSKESEKEKIPTSEDYLKEIRDILAAKK